MLFKLALKNMQKSVKDYAIYFFTLVFAVAMFYTFNSLDAQTSMSALNESSMTTIKQVVTIINYLSVFVAIVLGFLIVYANNFLIKRRKKEFGLYLTLGMSKRKVALNFSFRNYYYRDYFFSCWPFNWLWSIPVIFIINYKDV
jgi:putative ABC transport system permease protein